MVLTLTLIQKQLTHLVQVQNKTSLVDQKIELTLVILELQVVLVLTHTHLVEPPYYALCYIMKT